MLIVSGGANPNYNQHEPTPLRAAVLHGHTEALQKQEEATAHSM